jgi:hypothetical protein
MNFDAILSSSNIVVDAKICKDNEKDKDKDKECGIPIITKEKKEKAVDKTADKIATPEKAIDKAEKQDDVNIVIKSCKNITSKQALLIIPITKFFSNREVLNKLITILKGESISLRLIDWFVTNYCKNFNIMYNLNDYRPKPNGQTEEQLKSFDNFIIVHNNYKGQLKAYSKRNFDPFCRRNRIRFYYEDNKYFITTVGQLNFFKWAIQNYIIDYIQDHLKVIDEDMNLRCETVKKTGTKINPIVNSSAGNNEETKKNKIDGIIAVETQIKTRKGGATRKKRKEISQSASKSLSIHNYPTTLVFD